MSKVTKTLERILRGTSDANIGFEDLRFLLSHLGFAERIRGSHHIFSREGLAEILNLQSRGSKAKPYQVRQVRGVIISAGLAGESKSGPTVEEDSSSEEPTPPTPEGSNE